MKKRYEDLIIFRTRYGVYKYYVLSFRLYGGPVLFQRYINNILFEYLDYFYTVYINDIFIFFDNKTEYELYIKRVFQKLRETDF